MFSYVDSLINLFSIIEITRFLYIRLEIQKYIKISITQPLPGMIDILAYLMIPHRIYEIFDDN